MTNPSAVADPATFTLTPPEKIANWRPLVHWLLAIPHFIVVYVLGIVAQVVAVVAWFVIMFTGKLPEGMAGVVALSLRYQARAGAFAGFLYETYPPFAFDSQTTDPGDLADLRVDFTPALEDRNRLTVFFRFLLVIPHLIVLALVFIVASIAWFVGFFAVLFTGKWPEGLLKFVVGALRWNVRVQAYMMLLNDEYPPFSLD